MRGRAEMIRWGVDVSPALCAVRGPCGSRVPAAARRWGARPLLVVRSGPSRAPVSGVPVRVLLLALATRFIW